MKRVLSVFLALAVLLCLSVTALAAEGEDSQLSAYTVRTLDELKAALAAAADGDSISVSSSVKLSSIPPRILMVYGNSASKSFTTALVRLFCRAKSIILSQGGHTGQETRKMQKLCKKTRPKNHN